MSDQEEKPPVFSSWKGWYVLVMSVALVQLIIYFLITNSFR
jgi:hypothetical protein